jgi:quercetin dioxygenase-like cupin family protein
LKAPILTAVILLLASASLRAQTAATESSRPAIVVPAGTEKFGLAPEILPPGATLAVLEGNPMHSGTYTMRLAMPSGYTIPPHSHPSDEHVTVVKGTFLVGMGAAIDASKFVALPAGSFGMLPPGMQHYARARGATVIQLHGTGPWRLTYVNPADDPRAKAR